MSDFIAKMHQNPISAAAPPQTPLGGVYSVPTDPSCSLFNGPTSIRGGMRGHKKGEG